MRRKTAVQAESEKQRLIDCVPVREPPFAVVPHLRGCVCSGKNFLECDGPPERRLRPVNRPTVL